MRSVTADGSATLDTAFNRNRNGTESGVSDAALARDGVGEFLHRCEIPAQDRDFEAVLLIEMPVQSRDLEVVAGMMGAGQSPCQLARPVVVDVGKNGDAFACDAVSEHSMPNPLRAKSRTASERLS